MKLRNLLFLAAASFSAASAFAQKGIEDGSKYGLFEEHQCLYSVCKDK